MEKFKNSGFTYYVYRFGDKEFDIYRYHIRTFLSTSLIDKFTNALIIKEIDDETDYVCSIYSHYDVANIHARRLNDDHFEYMDQLHEFIYQ